MTKEEIDKATGELIIAIGNGKFRDAVAMLVDRVAREAYIRGTESAHGTAKDAIDRRWKEFDAAITKAMDTSSIHCWTHAAMCAQKVRNLMQ